MIFITSKIFYYVEGVESFPLESIDEKKYFYTILLSMEITLTSILKGYVVDFIFILYATLILMIIALYQY